MDGSVAELSESSARIRVSTNNPYERRVGYSRAVRIGDMVIVGGTTAVNQDGVIIHPSDAYQQTLQTLQTIKWAFEEAGATLEDVINYRVYVTQREDIPHISQALSETFKTILPTNTLVVVAGLADPNMLVEIEAQALIGSASPVEIQDRE